MKYSDIIFNKSQCTELYIHAGFCENQKSVTERNISFMAGSTYGNLFKITTWGESHGAAIGVVVDGCPAGLSLCEEDIQKYLNRRKPGQTQ